MKLADHIRVDVGGAMLILRPSLRSACRLDARYDGFDAIMRGAMGGNLTIMLDVVKECCDPASIPDLIAIRTSHSVNETLKAMAGPIVDLTYTLAGIDPDAPSKAGPASDDPPPSFGDYFERLYRIGTGWLGWPPEAVWNASPMEITEAYKGRLELLKAMFGASDESDEDKSKPPVLDRGGLAALKLMGTR